MKLTAILAAIALPFLSYSQTTSYKVITDDPGQISNVSLTVLPLYVDISTGIKETIGQNTYRHSEGLVAIGFGLKAEMNRLPFAGDKIKADITYRRGNPVEYNHIHTLKGKKMHVTDLSLTASIELFGGENTEYNSVNVGSTFKTITSLSDVPMKRKKSLRLRVGTNTINAPVMFGFNFGRGTKIFAQTVYGGLEYVETVNFVADIDGYGVNKHSTRLKAFVDLISVPVSNVKYRPVGPANGKLDVSNFDETEFDAQTFADTNGIVQKVGLLSGIEFEMNPADRIALNFSTSFGVRAPYAGFYAYIASGIKINLSK